MLLQAESPTPLMEGITPGNLEEPIRLVAKIYQDAVIETVAHYTGDLPTTEPVPPRSFERGLAAIVGFGDGMVSGTSVLLAERGDVLTLAGEAVSDPQDWLGELNNQAVGRMKNRLMRYGITVQMSTPMTAVGLQLGFAAIRGDALRWVVAWKTGRLTGILGLTIAQGVELIENQEAEVAEEGSLNLF